MVVVVNHVPGFGYDANGDVTNDGANTYAYNVEGRPMTVNGYGQIFDAFDRLVESQNAGGYTSIVYSPDGYKLALMHGSAVVKYMAPLAAGMQAVYTANTPAGVAYWRHADWLGSSRLATTVGQTVYYDGAYAPFGESYAETGTTDRSFTGQTQDTTPGLYDFLFRQQSQSQGRWLVPDPAGLAAVDITNPQSWNRYAYVGNNPLNATDPLGLYCAVNADLTGTFNGCQQGGGWGGGGGNGYPEGTDTDDNIIIMFSWPTWGGSGAGGSGGSSGGGGSYPPSGGGGTGGGGNIANFPNGESLGIPNGLPTNPWGIAGALIPSGNCADMGPCNPIGSGFLAAGLPSVSIFTLSPGFVNYIELFFQMGKSGSCQPVTGDKKFFYAVCEHWDPPMVFVGPAWTCTGDLNCCLGAMRTFTDSCPTRGLRGAYFIGAQHQMEAACCKLP